MGAGSFRPGPQGPLCPLGPLACPAPVVRIIHSHFTPSLGSGGMTSTARDFLEMQNTRSGTSAAPVVRRTCGEQPPRPPTACVVSKRPWAGLQRCTPGSPWSGLGSAPPRTASSVLALHDWQGPDHVPSLVTGHLGTTCPQLLCVTCDPQQSWQCPPCDHGGG